MFLEITDSHGIGVKLRGETVASSCKQEGGNENETQCQQTTTKAGGDMLLLASGIH